MGVRTVEIKNVAVVEKWQGRGIGKQLVLDAIQVAKRLGYEKIEIGTGNSSVWPLLLYQACGFRIVGVVPDFFFFFADHYEEPIIENGIACIDMVRLAMEL